MSDNNFITIPKNYQGVVTTKIVIDDIIDYCKENNCEMYALTELNAETVTHLLDLNVRNRVVTTGSKNTLTSDVEGIGYHCVDLMSVSREGRLINGQHRLMVIQEQILSGKWTSEVQMVQFGLEEKWNDIIDNGIKRKIVDTLNMNGVDVCKLILSGCSVYLKFFDSKTIPTANRVREEYENRFYHVTEIGDMTKCVTFAGLRFKPAPWIVACFRVIQEAYGTKNAKKVYKELFENESISSPMGAFRTFYTSGKLKITFDSGSRVPGRKNNIIRNGYFFNMAKKCIQGVEKVTQMRSQKLGVEIRGKEF